MHDHKEKSGDNILENLIDTIADAVPKQKPSRFFNEGTSVFDKSNDKLNKLFGRQKSVHRIFGGGKSADVLLWRNKKISSSVLIGGTLVVLCLWATVIIGGLCNFLTLLYIGFVTVHIGPVLYEKYEDQVDDFISRVLELVNQQYRRVDKDLLSKIPKGSLKTRKND